jgi:hypothetical protein
LVAIKHFIQLLLPHGRLRLGRPATAEGPVNHQNHTRQPEEIGRVEKYKCNWNRGQGKHDRAGNWDANGIASPNGKATGTRIESRALKTNRAPVSLPAPRFHSPEIDVASGKRPKRPATWLTAGFACRTIRPGWHPERSTDKKARPGSRIPVGFALDNGGQTRIAQARSPGCQRFGPVK